MEGLNMSLECTRESRSNGTCYGLAVCGFCYDFAETRQVSKEYEQFNLVSRIKTLATRYLENFHGILTCPLNRTTREILRT